MNSNKEKALDARLAPPKTGITVRMYHTGFGDCLLLAYRADNGEPRYVLIDCGVHHQYKGGEKRMKLVSEDIAKVTGNKLHIVAVTHEHTDHLYGFMHGEKAFKEIEIDELWLAWTEDPENPIALKLKEKHKNKIKALQLAISQLRKNNNPLASRLTSVLEFDLASAKSIALQGNKDILKFLRSRSSKKLEKPEDYKSPNDAPFKLPDAKGFKCYVLGPPQDPELIKKLEDPEEMYLAAMNEEKAFMAAVLAASDTSCADDDPLFRRSAPFDKKFEMDREDVESYKKYAKFFRKYYGFSDKMEDGPEWRRIETDWLAAAERLALNIDSWTNNTSLALAIEMTETVPPKVLLFAADAQVGNWLSWYKLEWQTEGANMSKVTGPDLLQRTVLYKVGHHGSLNGTLREKGLEMMKSNELVAMIPVDEEWARNRDWSHPEERLVKQLKAKTRGRVIRSDKIPTTGTMDKPPEANDVEWKAFLENLEWDEGPDRLWIQYTVQ
jgi:Metallo-beta-lactamase superfamily